MAASASPNSVDALNAIYHAPRLLTRENPAFAEPMAAIRKATADRTAGKPEADPVTPEATKEAKILLTQLYSFSGHQTLSGQQNTPQALTAATDAAITAATKRPAIYGQELAITSEMAMDPAAARHAIEEEAIRQHRAGAIVSLTWRPIRPTDDQPASEAKSVRGQLTDFEWNELLTPRRQALRTLVEASRRNRTNPKAPPGLARTRPLAALSPGQRQGLLVGWTQGNPRLGGSLSPAL